MSSRRSSRLSANATALKEDTDIANGTVRTAQPKPTMETKKRKAPSKENLEINRNDAGPSTPKKKRTTKILPPDTPTPKAIGLMSSPQNNNSLALPAVNRLAVPNGTNAPLVSPETHRLISSRPIDQVSPSKKSNATSTTKDLLDEAVAHLIKTEPKLKPIIEKHPCRVFSAEGLADEIDPFNSLVSGIISQQVSKPSELPSHLLFIPSSSYPSFLNMKLLYSLSKHVETGFRSGSQVHQGQVRSSVQRRGRCRYTYFPNPIPGLHQIHRDSPHSRPLSTQSRIRTWPRPEVPCGRAHRRHALLRLVRRSTRRTYQSQRPWKMECRDVCVF